MFSLKLRRVFYVVDKVIIRNLRSKKLEVANPGLQRRIKAFREEGLQVDVEDAEDYVEGSDSDFSKSGQVYKEQQRESLANQIHVRHQIVKEKYFKENLPNLLTWSEKDQIRHLAHTQPDEWTVEKIAASFPVTEAVVKKLLKYPWTPSTQERIARHDASAMRNWRELKVGTLDIPENLRQHFLKFSERKIPPLNKRCLKIDTTPHTNMGEFESIINRCASNEKSTEEYKDLETSEETSLSVKSEAKPVPTGNAKITLEELTRRVKNRIEEGGEVNTPDRLMYTTINNSNLPPSTKDMTKEIDLYTEEKKDNEITEYKPHNDENTKIMDYPLRIRIPKKAYKKGATFKVNDCYYDHDGKFLYRVLGMTS